MRISRLLMPAVTLAGALALAGCGGGSDSPMKKDPPGGDGCDEGEIEYNGSCMTAAEIEAAGVKKGEENASMNTAKAERAKALVDVLGNVGKNNATPPVPADVDLNAQTYDTNGPAIVGNTIASVLKKGSDSLTAGTIGGYSYSGEGAGGSKLSGAIFAIGKTEEQEDIKDAAGAAAAAGLVGVSWNTDDERLVIGTGLPAAEVSGFEISESSGLEAGQNSPAVGKRFAGELYGLPGHYLCVVDTCMVTIVSSGTTLSDAGWVFEPTGGGSAKVSSAVADNLRFGWWITEDKEGEITQVDLHVVGGGADDDADGYARRSASISSKATYTGGAAGQYAHHSDDSSDYGAFTASAELTATFDSDTYGNSTLEGTIDSFLVDGKAKPGWEVKLSERQTGAGGLNGTDGDSDITWHDGNRTIADDGGYVWAAYGGDADSITTLPGAVGGVFNVYNDDSRLAGAFGASDPKLVQE